MVRKFDWVLVELQAFPENVSPDNLMQYQGMYVGIVTANENGYVTVDLVDNLHGHTLGTIVVPEQFVSLAPSRDVVPPLRLATYDPNWQPRGARNG